MGDSNLFLQRSQTSPVQHLSPLPPTRLCAHSPPILPSGTSHDTRMTPLAAWKHAGPLLPRSALHTSLGSLLRRSSPRCSRGLQSVPSLTGASWAGPPGSILRAEGGGWQRRGEERPTRRRALNPGTRAGSQLEAELGLRAHSLSIWSTPWQVSDASLYGPCSKQVRQRCGARAARGWRRAWRCARERAVRGRRLRRRCLVMSLTYCGAAGPGPWVADGERASRVGHGRPA